MSNVPAVVPVQRAIGMDPSGMVIAKVPVLPFIVPVTDIVVPPRKPEKLTVPMKLSPFCVICQVMVPAEAIPTPIPDPTEIPIAVPLESEAVPVHVPVTAGACVGPAGLTAAVVPPHAAAVAATRNISEPIQARIRSPQELQSESLVPFERLQEAIRWRRLPDDGNRW